MSKEIEIKKRCICIRGGNEIWISEETYQKFRKAKEQAGGNILIYVSELDRELNTADIVEICTPLQMNDKRRIERGERKCSYGQWHKKRERCNCYRKIVEKFENDKLRIKQAEEIKPLTPEQQKSRKKILDDTTEWLKKKGILKSKNI